MFLPDVNVWVALAFRAHTHHATAKDWFEQVPEGGCSFCRFTQLGFLRLATNRHALGKAAVTLVKAWSMYDAFRDDPRVLFAEEPAPLESDWRAFTSLRSRSPNLWADAYLAAFARAAAFDLVTFDKAFAQFKNVRCTVLG